MYRPCRKAAVYPPLPTRACLPPIPRMLSIASARRLLLPALDAATRFPRDFAGHTELDSDTAAADWLLAIHSASAPKPLTLPKAPEPPVLARPLPNSQVALHLH